MARMLWNIIKCAFNLLDIPDNEDALRNTWLKISRSDEKNLTFKRVFVVLSAIWKIRNSTIPAMQKLPTVMPP